MKRTILSRLIDYVIYFLMFVLAFYVSKYYFGDTTLDTRVNDNINLEVSYDKDHKILVSEDDSGIHVKEMDLTRTTK